MPKEKRVNQSLWGGHHNKKDTNDFLFSTVIYLDSKEQFGTRYFCQVKDIHDFIFSIVVVVVVAAAAAAAVAAAASIGCC